MNSVKRRQDDWTTSHREIFVYETQSKFYMMRSDKSRSFWKVLTIDRLNPLELTMCDHSVTYSSSQRITLLEKINLRNTSTGGLKFITMCHGIIGFVQFSGPYYMVLITEKAQIGSILNHEIYTITKTEMIPLSNSTYRSKFSNSKNENRYKELFCKIDLTKDFFFSYTYCIMHTIQKNLCNNNTMEDSYNSMFVWNEFMTRGIRRQLNNTLWTVALVYGFFKQISLSTYVKDFTLTLISRRSRHFAGTRYLKRGVNKEGKVANEVETEQIVFHDLPQCLTEVTSVVQHRGSIPIFWSQETSLLNVKPGIIVSKKQNNLEATRLHFEDMFNRYGNSIIILNLIKTWEKEPRESIIHTEFVNAVNAIIPNLPKCNCLEFIHKDLNELSKREGANVLKILGRVGKYALFRTGFFYGQVTPDLDLQNGKEGFCPYEDNDSIEMTYANYESDDDTNMFENPSEETINEFQSTSYLCKSPKLQNGVLRTNCIDCLDRTNVAQFAYGLASLQLQLYTLHLIYSPRVDLDEPLANDLMTLYEEMGDILAMQYGGSGAHNKIFSLRRGHWKAHIRSLEFLRIVRRFCSNIYMDPEKQRAINVFLGNFHPEFNFGDEISSSHSKRYQRSYSDGILCNIPVSDMNAIDEPVEPVLSPSCEIQVECHSLLPDSTPATPSGSEPALLWSNSLTGRKKNFVDSEHWRADGSSSNIIEFGTGTHSSLEISSTDELFYERSSVISSSGNITCEIASGVSIYSGENKSGIKGNDTIEDYVGDDDIPGVSAYFKNWVLYGHTFWSDEFL